MNDARPDWRERRRRAGWTGANLLRLGWLVLGVLAFVATPFFLFGAQIETLFTKDGAVTLLQGTDNAAWARAIALLIADIALPIPTSAVMAGLGMIYGPVVGGAVAAVGSISSGLIGYAMCRVLGRPMAVWLNGQDSLMSGERVFTGKTGGWLIVMSRWLPVLSEVLACLAGLARMPFPRFLLALSVGSIPLGFAYALIGHLGGATPLVTLAGSAVLPAAIWLAYTGLRRGS